MRQRDWNVRDQQQVKVHSKSKEFFVLCNHFVYHFSVTLPHNYLAKWIIRRRKLLYPRPKLSLDLVPYRPLLSFWKIVCYYLDCYWVRETVWVPIYVPPCQFVYMCLVTISRRWGEFVYMCLVTISRRWGEFVYMCLVTISRRWGELCT